MVCKSCGSEVSPYVTECPYCGHRLRKRAPRLEREGDEIRVHESRRERRRRLRRERREQRQLAEQLGDTPQRRLRMPNFGLSSATISERPVATISVLMISAVLIVLERAVPWDPSDVGAIVGPVGNEVWRYVASPFVYDDLGALIVVGGSVALFGTLVEARIGSLATAVLILACGSGGMLAADASATVGFQDGFLIAAGGNGVALGLLAAWLMLRRAEVKTTFSESADLLGVSVVAVVLLLLPVVEITADPISGLIGGLIGLALGWLAAVRLPASSG